MLPDGRALGAHLPLASGMVKAVERARSIGADTLQIFTDDPTAWVRRAEPPAERDAFRARLRDLGMAPVAIHAAYLVNLAGPDAGRFARSVELMGDELRGAPAFGAGFVNVHIGAHGGSGIAAGVERVAEAVSLALDAVDAAPEAAMLVLENAAGSGWAVGTNIDELASIAAAIDRRGVSAARVGFCLDTAHAWAAGIDVGTPDAIDAFLDEFDRRIGLGRLVMVHLNDSRSERGSRLDRHEHLGAGRIGIAGLAHLLRHPALTHTLTILETPGMDAGYDAVNVRRAWALASGAPLDDLAPGAFEVRSARGRTAPS